ncbi:MAG: DUF2784 domain-containing protein [Spirochaetia bacterium]
MSAGYTVLADLIVVLHFLYVSFTVGGELLIVLGAVLRWAAVRNLPFRVVHLASVLLVAVEALAGAACPLTVWEYRLRMLGGQRVEAQISFVARIVRSIIFYNFPAWVFLAAYVAFAAAVVLTFILLPPAVPRSAAPRGSSAPRGTGRSAERRTPHRPD